MGIKQFKKLLADKKTILMDGAMGTEILHHGASTKLPLWSAEVLLSKPQIVRQIHEEYIQAGAEIIITNTFSTTRRNFGKNGISQKAREATILACKLANEARQNIKTIHPVYIAGSVAPLEDCYSPQLTPSLNELSKEHLELAQDLRDGGVDFILVETMITLRETEAALHAAHAVGLPVAVSFCCNDKFQLLSGEPLADAVAKVKDFNPLFIGVNCLSLEIATDVVHYLRTLTELPISVYAQGDGVPETTQGWKFTNEHKQAAYLSAVQQWLKDGAQIIGGCCGTTPDHIKSINALI